MNIKSIAQEKSLFAKIYFFYYFTVGSYNAYIFLHFKNLGFSGQRLGILAGLGPLVILLSQFLWGVFADKITKKKELIVALNIVVCLVALVYSFMTAYLLVLVIMVLFHFFNSPIGPLTDSATLTFLGNDSNQFGKFRHWGSLSFCAATYLTGWLSEFFGLRVIFYVHAAAVVAVAFFASKLKTVNVHIGVDFTARENTRTFKKLLKEIGFLLADKKIVFFWIGHLLLFITINANFVTYALLWTDLGGSRSLLGLSWTAAALLEVPIFIYSAKLLRKVPAGVILSFACFLAAVRWYVFYSATSYYHLLMVQPLHSVIFALATAAGIYFIGNYASKEIKFSAQTILTGLNYGVSAVIGNYIAGLTYDSSNPGRIYIYSAVFTLAASICFIIFNHTVKKNKT